MCPNGKIRDPIACILFLPLQYELSSPNWEESNLVRFSANGGACSWRLEQMTNHMTRQYILNIINYDRPFRFRAAFSVPLSAAHLQGQCWWDWELSPFLFALNYRVQSGLDSNHKVLHLLTMHRFNYSELIVLYMYIFNPSSWNARMSMNVLKVLTIVGD